MSWRAERRAPALPRRRPRLAAARPHHGGAGPARRPTALRRVGRRATASPGDVIETGTWRGGASMLMRATLDSLGERERTVWVADSFQGFPEVEHDLASGYDLDADLAGVRLPRRRGGRGPGQLRPLRPRGGSDVRPGLLPGHTPVVASAGGGRSPGSTATATTPLGCSLEALYPNLAVGGYLIVDDYLALDPCRKAVDDFRREHGITEPIEPIDWSAARGGARPSPLRCRRRRAGPVTGGRIRARTRAVAREPRQRIPAVEEMALVQEVSELRARLEAAEREIEELRSHPLRAARAWGSRHRLRRAGRDGA